MSEHTPGPWKARETPAGGLKVFGTVDLGADKPPDHHYRAGARLLPLYDVSLRPELRVGEDGCAYAMLAYNSYYQFPHVDFRAMQHANAHLIAASPDLLEALEECADHIASSSSLMGDDPMVVKARAAIAKARGTDE